MPPISRRILPAVAVATVVTICVAAPGIGKRFLRDSSTATGAPQIIEATMAVSVEPNAPAPFAVSFTDPEDQRILNKIGSTYRVATSDGISDDDDEKDTDSAPFIGRPGGVFSTLNFDSPDHSAMVLLTSATRKSEVTFDAILRLSAAPAKASGALISLLAPLERPLVMSDSALLTAPGDHHLQMLFGPNGLEVRIDDKLTAVVDLDPGSFGVADSTTLAFGITGFSGQLAELSLTRQFEMADGSLRATLLSLDDVDLKDAQAEVAATHLQLPNQSVASSTANWLETVENLNAGQDSKASQDQASAANEQTPRDTVTDETAQPGPRLVQKMPASVLASAQTVMEPVRPIDRAMIERNENSVLSPKAAGSSGVLEMAGLDNNSLLILLARARRGGKPAAKALSEVAAETLSEDITAETTNDNDVIELTVVPPSDIIAGALEDSLLLADNSPAPALRSTDGVDDIPLGARSGERGLPVATLLPPPVLPLGAESYDPEVIQEAYSNSYPETVSNDPNELPMGYDDAISRDDPLLVALEAQQRQQQLEAEAILQQGITGQPPAPPVDDLEIDSFADEPLFVQEQHDSEFATDTTSDTASGNVTGVVLFPGSTAGTSTSTLNDSRNDTDEALDISEGEGNTTITASPIRPPIIVATTSGVYVRPEVPPVSTYLGIDPAVSPGVVAYFPLDGSGEDRRGEVASVTLRNRARFDDGSFDFQNNTAGQAVRLDGLNDELRTSIEQQKLVVNGVTERVSMSAMVYVEQWRSSVIASPSILQMSLPGGRQIALIDAPGGRKVRGNRKTVFDDARIDDALRLNRWQHIRIDLTYDGYELYVNGDFVAASANDEDLIRWAEVQSEDPIEFIAGNFRGWIDEVVIVTSPSGGVSNVLPVEGSTLGSKPEDSVQQTTNVVVASGGQPDDGGDSADQSISSGSGSGDSSGDGSGGTDASGASSGSGGIAPIPGGNLDGTTTIYNYALADGFGDAIGQGPELTVIGDVQFDLASPTDLVGVTPATRFLAAGDELSTFLDLESYISGRLLVVVLEARIRVNAWAQGESQPILELIANDEAWFSLSSNPGVGPRVAGAGQVLLEGERLDSMLNAGEWRSLSFVMTDSECIFGIDDVVVATRRCSDALAGWPTPNADLVLGNFDGWIRDVEVRLALEAATDAAN